MRPLLRWLDQAPLWRSLVTSDKSRFGIAHNAGNGRHIASLMLGISSKGAISAYPKHYSEVLLLG